MFLDNKSIVVRTPALGSQSGTFSNSLFSSRHFDQFKKNWIEVTKHSNKTTSREISLEHQHRGRVWSDSFRPAKLSDHLVGGGCGGELGDDCGGDQLMCGGRTVVTWRAVSAIHHHPCPCLLLVVTKFSMSNQLFGLSIPPPPFPSPPSPPHNRTALAWSCVVLAVALPASYRVLLENLSETPTTPKYL